MCVYSVCACVHVCVCMCMCVCVCVCACVCAELNTSIASAQCKLLYAQVVLGKDHQRKLQRVTKTSAGRVFALVAGMKTPPAQVAEGQGDWTLASIGASWSGMQQRHATYTWALTCIVVVPMLVALLLHPAPSCADGCWFLVPHSENNLPTLVVVTLCNLHWWSFS